MREPLQMGEQPALQIVDQSMTGESRPVVPVVAGGGLRPVGEQEHDAQRGELALDRRSEPEQVCDGGTPVVDSEIDAIRLWMSGKQDVNYVSESNWERERKGKLADAHQRSTRNQLRVRLQIGQEPKQRMLRGVLKFTVRIHKTPFVSQETGPPRFEPVKCNRRAPSTSRIILRFPQ